MTDDEKESLWRDPSQWDPESLERAEEELRKILARFRKAREKKQVENEQSE